VRVDFTVCMQDDLVAAATSTSIAAISLLVGRIGVMIIVLVSVTERTREIRIRVSVGARQYDMLVEFLIEALVLNLFAGILGIVVENSASSLISTFEKWPVIITVFPLSCHLESRLRSGSSFGSTLLGRPLS
jgi:putative ABC transport system permease protein